MDRIFESPWSHMNELCSYSITFNFFSWCSKKKRKEKSFAHESTTLVSACVSIVFSTSLEFNQCYMECTPTLIYCWQISKLCYRQYDTCSSYYQYNSLKSSPSKTKTVTIQEVISYFSWIGSSNAEKIMENFRQMDRVNSLLHSCSFSW
jgi:hypothetical protein